MDELIDLLREVSGGFQRRLQKMPSLHKLKLAPFQARLLTIVDRHPGCSQQDLAGWTGRDKAQVARTIRELEASNLLARTAHASDWRSRSLAVTDEGARVCMLIAGERAALGAAITQELTQQERRVMILTLEKIKRRLADTCA